MKKKSIFIDNNNKIIDNNQKYCEVEEVIDTSELVNNSNINIDDKLDKLFNQNGYVFSNDVRIITNDKTYQTKIAGKVNNYLITMDNDVIDISTIKDVIY